MEIKIFSDSVKALAELTKAILGLVDLPAAERKRYRDLLHETFGLLDSAILLVVTRLGDLLQLADGNDRARFLKDLQVLSYEKEWETIARDVRLCRSLRAASAEMDTLVHKLGSRIAIRDPRALTTLIDRVLDREYLLAQFIASSLERLAGMASSAANSAKDYQRAIDEVRQTRAALRAERDLLIQEEVSSFKVI